jgi:cytochrome c5
MKPILPALLIVILSACGQQKSDSPAESTPPAVSAPGTEAQPVVPVASPVAATPAIPEPASTPVEPVSGAAKPAPRPPAGAAAPTAAPRAEAPAASPAPADPAAGRQTYQQACAFCHDKGVAGAPRMGDTAAWSTRTAQGVDALYASALRGKGAMPAKGGNPALSDDTVKAAVDFLVAGSR